jgi:hypothetical protein
VTYDAATVSLSGHGAAGAPEPVLALDRWRATLATNGHPDTLLAAVGELTLDLTHAHPSGLAMLMAGRSTRLSHLVREPARLATARRRASAIEAATDQLAGDRGLRACHLAAGVVSWAGRPGPAPVLLRGCTLRGRGGDDFTLDVDDVVHANPEVLRLLRSEHGLVIDPAALTGLAFGRDGFDPTPVFGQLEQLCAAVPGFRLERRLIVASFTDGGRGLVADLEASRSAVELHPVLGALAVVEPELDPDALVVADIVVGVDPEPEADASVLDLDPAQRAAVASVVAGRHVVIEGPPGVGATHTLTDAVAELVGVGRRVLVVTPHRGSAQALVQRLGEVGLGDVVLDLYDGVGERTRLLMALGMSLGRATVAATAEPDGVAEAVAALREVRDELDGACAALHAPRQPWQVSAYDAMVALAELVASDSPPRTRVRLPQQVCLRLDTETRERLRHDLRAAAELRAFKISRLDTRWLDAQVTSEHDARQALDAAAAAREQLPSARSAMADLCTAVGLARPSQAADWPTVLSLLLDVRTSLDLLAPAAFELPDGDLADDVPEADGVDPDTGWRARRARRRRQQAVVRPGTQVEDLEQRLLAVRDQRRRWAELSIDDAGPRVPLGLAEAQRLVGRLEASLQVLAPVLAPTGTPELSTLDLPHLERTLGDLADDGAGVLEQPQRTVLLQRLRDAGLSDLLDDLRERRSGPEDVDGELDLAWWTSVLETIIRGDARLARHDPQRLRWLLDTLRERQADLRRARAAAIAAAAATRAAAAVADHPEQSRWLRSEVHRAHRSVWPGDLFREALDVVGALRPVWVMSPEAVAACLPPARVGAPLVDVVVIDDASQVGLPEAAAAMARGRRLLVAGDRHRLPPAAGGPSVMHSLSSQSSSLLPAAERVYWHRLDRDHRTRDGRLLRGLRQSYPWPWQQVPGAAPTSPFTLEHVIEGTSLPGPGEQMAESADAEVRRVVQLVALHALRRPGESLMVVTLGMRHAERIEQALHEQADLMPALAQWLEVYRSGQLREPFLVRPIHRVTGLERDAVIFSVGLPRTPHGRVLHRFGVLDGRFGEACLVTALSRARRRTVLVCCFDAEALTPDRLRSPGSQLLHDVLATAADPRQRGDHLDPFDYDRLELDRPVEATGDPGRLAADGADALVVDLRERLEAVGLSVALGPQVPDWPLALTVADPDAPGRRVLAVDVDSREPASCPSLSLRERGRRESFERAGWTYLRVSAMDLFCDPASEVDRIRNAWRAAGGGTAAPAPVGPIVGRPRVRGPFPDVAPGRPVTDYGDDELEAVATWVLSDGAGRTPDELASAMREALHLPRRGLQVEVAVGGAARRVLDGGPFVTLDGASDPDLLDGPTQLAPVVDGEAS